MTVRHCFVLAALLLAGCSNRHAAPPPRAGEAPSVERETLVERPLDQYIPAAGLRWLAIGRPRELFGTRWLRLALDRLLPDERLDAYEAATGFDLRLAEEGAVAGFDYGTLFLARSGSTNEQVEQNFRDRMVAGAIEHRPHPDLLVLSGLIQETPAALVSQRGHLVGAAFGDPTLSRIVEAYARGRLRSVTALRGAALTTLSERTHDAPARFYAPGPFTGSWRDGIQGILGAATAVGVAFRPRVEGIVRVDAEIAGDWSEDGGRARAAAEQFYADLASSSLGRLLALDEPAAPPIVTVTPDRISLSVDLALGPVVDGLYAAVSADVWELLGPSTPNTGEESTSQ